MKIKGAITQQVLTDDIYHEMEICLCVSIRNFSQFFKTFTQGAELSSTKFLL